MSDKINEELYTQIALMATDLELLSNQPRHKIVSLLLNYYTIPNPMTYKDIALVWNISNQRAAVLVNKAIKKIKNPAVAIYFLRSVSKETYELFTTN